MKNFLVTQKMTLVALLNRIGFTSSLILTLGLTVGFLLSTMTLVNLVLFKPLPYPEQDNLVLVENIFSSESGGVNTSANTYPGLVNLYKKQPIFTDASMLTFSRETLTSSSTQSMLNIGYVTPEWFTIFNPLIEKGRVLNESESLYSNNPVAVLSHETWRTEYDSDKNILDKKLEFLGTSYRIIGVLSESFEEPRLITGSSKTDIWVPWDFNPAKASSQRWDGVQGNLYFIGKLGNAFSLSQSEQILTPLVNDVWSEKVAHIEFFSDWKIQSKLKPLTEVVIGDSRKSILLLAAGAIGLMLIALANVSNILMSSTVEQQKNLAIRAAMGANNVDIFKYFLSQHLNLVLFSVTLGLVVTFGFNQIIKMYFWEMFPRSNELSVDIFTLVLALVILILVSFSFALISSKMIDYRKLIVFLQSGGKSTGVQISERTRKILISSQVAIAAFLIFVNINLYREASSILESPMNFKVTDVHHLQLGYLAPNWPTNDAMTQINDNVVNKLNILAEVKHVSRSTSPFRKFGLETFFNAESNVKYTVQSKSVDDLYFKSLNQTLLKGDYFSPSDVRDNNPVLIVNNVLAKKLEEHGEVIGSHVSISEEQTDVTYRIIGIVNGAVLPGESEIPMRMYRPFSLYRASMLVKLKDGFNLDRERIVSILNEEDRRLSIYKFTSLEDERRELLSAQITTSNITSLLIIVSLFLTGVGLYGVINYSVETRKFELATRMAVGAEPLDIVYLIVRSNVTSVFFGIFACFALMLIGYLIYPEILAEYLSNQLISTLIISLLALISLVLLACYFPLRKVISRPVINSLKGF